MDYTCFNCYLRKDLSTIFFDTTDSMSVVNLKTSDLNDKFWAFLDALNDDEELVLVLGVRKKASRGDNNVPF